MRDIEKYANDYYEKSFEDYLYEYRLKVIKYSISKYNKKRILEIGCGRKPVFNYLSDFDLYVAFEPSKSSFVLAENDASLINKKMGQEKVICINDYFSSNDDLRKYEFDMILLTGLLHEIDSPDRMLEDVRKISYDNTVISIFVSNANSFHRLLAKDMHIINDIHQLTERNIKLQQNTVFDEKSLEQLVDKSGLKKLESYTYFIKPFTHDQMLSMLKHNIIDEGVLDGLFELGFHMDGIGAEICMHCGKK